MAPLFGGGRERRDRLLNTVRSLGSTTVPDLAAALALSESETERVLRDALRHRPTELRFDPVHRSIAWDGDPPPPEALPGTGPSAAPPDPSLGVPAAISGGAATAPAFARAGPPLRAPVCPHCRVTAVTTGSMGKFACPQCGWLGSGSTRAVDPGPRASEADPAPDGTVRPADRRSQELFAAWVTGEPIPCPRCRTTLRHERYAEYRCPGCGHAVHFGRSGGPSAASPAPAAPAPASAPGPA
jgi:predicted RNA-binding Zn-ribbon protein involved in translation (DUF1610 family)